MCSTHLLAPDVYNTGTFINLCCPLTAGSGGGVVFVPGPGCTFGQKCPKNLVFFLNACWVLIFLVRRYLGREGILFGAQRYSGLQVPSYKLQKGGLWYTKSAFHPSISRSISVRVARIAL